jgi:hypothetical protein
MRHRPTEAVTDARWRARDNRPPMELGILVLVLLAVAVPAVYLWARRTFKEGPQRGVDADVQVSGRRLTSAALRDLPSPPWRVVHEIADDRLGGVEHVVIGPPGVFAVQTSMEGMPAPSSAPPDAQAVARSAVARTELDDALTRCGMSSDRLVVVHWGVPLDPTPPSVDVFPGLTAVDGRSLRSWAAGLGGPLTGAQVDLAWQTVTTAIGRPDPLD